jgi:hypothetical protein
MAVALYVFGDRGWRGELTFAVAVCGGAAALYSAYYNGAKLRSDLDRQRMQATFAMINSLEKADTQVVARLRDKQAQTSNDEIYIKITMDQSIEGSVDRVLGFAEDISIAAASGYADEDILFKSVRFIVVATWDLTKDYVKRERDRLASPSIFVQCERLAEAWAKDRSVRDGRALTH